ncbi:hypothetical protein H0H92_012270 [Tricholoma furcatifolium]|nr:hypothetical protein H0H92_012270 [Tricholoma furcatifolium]
MDEARLNSTGIVEVLTEVEGLMTTIRGAGTILLDVEILHGAQGLHHATILITDVEVGNHTISPSPPRSPPRKQRYSRSRSREPPRRPPSRSPLRHQPPVPDKDFHNVNMKVEQEQELKQAATTIQTVAPHQENNLGSSQPASFEKDAVTIDIPGSTLTDQKRLVPKQERQDLAVPPITQQPTPFTHSELPSRKVSSPSREHFGSTRQTEVQIKSELDIKPTFPEVKREKSPSPQPRQSPSAKEFRQRSPSPPRHPRNRAIPPAPPAHPRRASRSPPRGPRNPGLHPKGHVTPTGPASSHPPGPRGQRRPFQSSSLPGSHPHHQPSTPQTQSPNIPSLPAPSEAAPPTLQEAAKVPPPVIPLKTLPPSLTPEFDTEIDRVAKHRAHLAHEYTNLARETRRALHELDMATIDLHAAEMRRKVADIQYEKAKNGVLGIDYVPTPETIPL